MSRTQTPGSCGVRTARGLLAFAVVADLRSWPGGSVKRLAYLLGCKPSRVYRALQGRQPIAGWLLEGVVRHTGGAHVLAHFESLRPDEVEADAGRATRASGELSAVLVEDLADDGVVNDPRSFEAAGRVAAEATRLVRAGAALRERGRRR